MTPELRAKLQVLLGGAVTQTARVSGGDINQAFTVTLTDGRRVFVKTHHAPLPNMYLCEARGLEWLAAADALRVPTVLAASDADEAGPACLVLEWIESGQRDKSFAEALGRGLAKLHRTGASGFGLDHDNYIALLQQRNAPRADWPTFYAEQRIAPLTKRASDQARIDNGLRKKLDGVCARMAALVGPSEPAARLHGDLWGGNLLVDERSQPCLIDPAVYGGDRQIDLAMMHLFGGFSERVFAAYDEAYPLAPGHEERVALYQLYPLLVHVNLFGGQYASSLRQAVDSLA